MKQIWIRAALHIMLIILHNRGFIVFDVETKSLKPNGSSVCRFLCSALTPDLTFGVCVRFFPTYYRIANHRMWSAAFEDTLNFPHLHLFSEPGKDETHENDEMRRMWGNTAAMLICAHEKFWVSVWILRNTWKSVGKCVYLCLPVLIFDVLIRSVYI